MKIIAVIDHAVFGSGYLQAAEKAAPHAEKIWFRIKNAEAREIFEFARELRRILPSSELILSERADIAAAAGFNGVHLNARSVSAGIIKKTFPGLLIGYSAHSAEECRAVKADYMTLSPIFDSGKPSGGKPLGLINAPCPNVYALGGINAENYGLLSGLGFAGIAGIRLCREADKFPFINGQAENPYGKKI